MKGIDTNVLVRYILQDDVKQSKLATEYIEESPTFINEIVLCELVWVLETAYEYPKLSIAKVIEQILRTRQFHFQQPEILWKSLHGYKHDGADFADHYIGNLNLHYDCEYTVTFDKLAGRLKNFKLLALEMA